MTSMSALTVITGPSGVGKGTLVEKLLERNNSLWLSVSATTRSPREGEVEGKNYFFLEPKKFSDIKEKGGFLEWAEFAGNFYGTPKKQINEKISQGKNTPDLHGTILLVWAISMISELIELPTSNWKVLKP